MGGAWADEYFDMIGDCQYRESLLSEWETHFLDSIEDQLESGRMLTNKQIEKLEDIWERVTKND